MDISLSSINAKTGELKWSGANNPLWYIHDNELKEISPDKQPIGKHDKAVPFTTHNVSLKKGDTVYLFSDGYADQFGGEKGKKFKYRQFQELLLTNSSNTMENQKLQLEKALMNGKEALSRWMISS